MVCFILDFVVPFDAHWLSCVLSMTFLFSLSSIFLLMIPISDLEGLMNLHTGLLLKFGLWSFRVTNALFLAVTSIRLSRSRSVAMRLSWLMILDTAFIDAFL